MPTQPVINGWVEPAAAPVLQEGEVHIWLCPPCTQATAGEVLSEEERTRAAAFRREDLRTAYVGSHVALRHILATYTQMPPRQLSFTRGRWGKPGLVSSPELHFNLSHSGGYALIVVALEGPVGIDLEDMSAPAPFDVVPTICTPTEQELLARTDKGRRDDVFYALWTRKEALAKAMGLGLALDLRKLEVWRGLTEEVSQPGICSSISAPYPWHVFALPTIPGMAAALAAPARSLRCMHWLYPSSGLPAASGGYGSAG
ncbi:4'-phosphopantetheinyl transferase family protein [Acetobacteraceae bacterium AT-5844]|nr:4'-phosphopantetheinyl transferase family protein [Acetobacteraceae bacterium AT-5844]